jgi:hypothetical protein
MSEMADPRRFAPLMSGEAQREARLHKPVAQLLRRARTTEADIHVGTLREAEDLFADDAADARELAGALYKDAYTRLGSWRFEPPDPCPAAKAATDEALADIQFDTDHARREAEAAVALATAGATASAEEAVSELAHRRARAVNAREATAWAAERCAIAARKTRDTVNETDARFLSECEELRLGVLTLLAEAEASRAHEWELQESARARATETRERHTTATAGEGGTVPDGMARRYDRRREVQTSTRLLTKRTAQRIRGSIAWQLGEVEEAIRTQRAAICRMEERVAMAASRMHPFGGISRDLEERALALRCAVRAAREALWSA